MTTQRKFAAAALACAVVVSLTGWGSRGHIDLDGVAIGMTHDQVLAAPPAGSTLYCRGDSDAQFEKTAQLSARTSATDCT